MATLRMTELATNDATRSGAFHGKQVMRQPASDSSGRTAKNWVKTAPISGTLSRNRASLSGFRPPICSDPSALNIVARRA